MKRAGIIGVATIWATPIVQSVGAPAFAATGVCVPSDPSGCGGTCPGKCSVGLVCASAADCVSGLTCFAGTCKVPDGGTCQGATNAAKDTNCASGKCDNGQTNVCLKSLNATCTANNQCASNHCRTVGLSQVCTAA